MKLTTTILFAILILASCKNKPQSFKRSPTDTNYVIAQFVDFRLTVRNDWVREITKDSLLSTGDTLANGDVKISNKWVRDTTYEILMQFPAKDTTKLPAKDTIVAQWLPVKRKAIINNTKVRYQDIFGEKPKVN